MLWVDSIRRPSHSHHFWSVPEGVVSATVADLCIENVCRGMRLDDPAGAPLEGVEHLGQKAAIGIGAAILHHTPAEHRHCGCHREGKLHVITRVVIPTGEVDADIRAENLGDDGVRSWGHLCCKSL